MLTAFQIYIKRELGIVGHTSSPASRDGWVWSSAVFLMMWRNCCVLCRPAADPTPKEPSPTTGVESRN